LPFALEDSFLEFRAFGLHRCGAPFLDSATAALPGLGIPLPPLWTRKRLQCFAAAAGVAWEPVSFRTGPAFACRQASSRSVRKCCFSGRDRTALVPKGTRVPSPESNFPC